MRCRWLCAGAFQSTLPAWGETGRRVFLWSRGYFNPLSPHGERRVPNSPKIPRSYFNPLSPHGERRGAELEVTHAFVFQSTLPAWGETISLQFLTAKDKFQSTLPAWGETALAPARPDLDAISIHSPRMGRDRWGRSAPWPTGKISIHSPRMGRDISGRSAARSVKRFQSTLPAWGETRPVGSTFSRCIFQSTLPAWGETSRACRRSGQCPYFNPLSPHGERHTKGDRSHGIYHISIHSPRMGRDGIPPPSDTSSR